MKKAGIIIGVLIILLAVGIFAISKNIEKGKSTKGTSSNKQTQVTKVPITETPLPTATTIPEPTEIVTPEPTVEPTVEPKVEPTEVPKQTSAVLSFTEEELGAPSKEREEIVVISAKRVLLVDEQYGTSQGKMLTYCFDVLTPDNKKLILFVTDVVYDSFNIGDKLKVVYKVFINDAGAEFPIVSSVSSVE